MAISLPEAFVLYKLATIRGDASGLGRREKVVGFLVITKKSLAGGGGTRGVKNKHKF